MSNSFRLLEHTADMGIAAEGETLGELFIQATLGLRRIVSASDDIRQETELRVELQAQDLEELLVNWLGELVFLLESRQFLPASCTFDRISKQQLSARIRGETVDPARHPLDREVKAVTYHQIRVEQTDDGWRAQVYVDL